MKRTTLMAVGAFGALLLLVLLTREEKVNVGVPKLTLPALKGDVTSIELSGTPPVKLTQENGAWNVNGMVADDATVKPLVEGITSFRAADFITEKSEKHAEMEVDDAKGTKVNVTTSGGTNLNLVFGKTAKAGGVYVREAKSNQVFSSTSPLVWQVKKKASDFRKKSISTAAIADVVKVTVTQPSGVLTIVNQDNQWKLEPAPAKGFRFDADAALRLAQAVTSLSAQDFGDALGEQTATIELTLKDEKKVNLKLGKKNEQGLVPLTVDGDSQVYLLADFTAQQVLKSLEDMRDTTLLSAFDVEKVNRLSVIASGKATTVAKKGTQWAVTEPKPPADFKFDEQSVPGLLARLKTLKATKAVAGVSDAQAGLGKPTGTIELSVEGGAKQTIRFGAETAAKDGVYVKGTADGLTYVIPQGQKSSFEQGLEMFKQRPPPDMNQFRGLEQLPPEVRKQIEAQLRQRNN